MMLTGVNLLLRFAGTSFQIYITNRIGPAGVGLLQLIMSVGGLSMIAGMAGIRTGTMYLTAEEIGKQKEHNISWILSGCYRYSILCSGTVALLLYFFAPLIADHWLGDPKTVSCLRLYSAFLPASCLCGVLTGLFTAANKIGTLAIVEIVEQFISMTVTVLILKFWSGNHAVRACQAVILGSCIGITVTLLTLAFFTLKMLSSGSARIPIAHRLFRAAAPLALADVLKAGINTVENLMVPKRLQINRQIKAPLAAFGTVTGMVFPVIMFPACILFGLSELLIPELSRCNAAGKRLRIHYLVRRSLKIALLYGTLFSGLLFLSSEELCIRLYSNTTAVSSLKGYSLLIPMLYCDTIVDAMTKGLGQQSVCVRYNIITAAMDVIFLYILLPHWGMTGYFISFAITHAVNFLLSINRLKKITGVYIPSKVSLYTVLAAVFSTSAAGMIQQFSLRIGAYLLLYFSVLTLLQVLSPKDLNWVKGLLQSAKKAA